MNNSVWPVTITLRSLAPIACLLLSACNSTTFESPPGSNVVDCDRRLIGTWEARTFYQDHSKGELSYVYVPVGCHPIYLIEEIDGQQRIDIVQARFAHAGEADYLLITEMRNIDDESSDVSHFKDYELVRYELERNTLVISVLDHDKIGRMLAAGEIPGETRRSEPNGDAPRGVTVNFVAGSPQQIADILRGDIFHHEPLAKLRRIAKLPEPVKQRRRFPPDKSHEPPSR